MVELRPSGIQLVESELTPSIAAFENEIGNLRIKYVDLTGRGSGRRWINTESSVTFEIRSPSVTEMATLACAIGRLKPKLVDFMHACGEHCLVYYLTWAEEVKA